MPIIPNHSLTSVLWWLFSHDFTHLHSPSCSHFPNQIWPSLRAQLPSPGSSGTSWCLYWHSSFLNSCSTSTVHHLVLNYLMVHPSFGCPCSVPPSLFCAMCSSRLLSLILSFSVLHLFINNTLHHAETQNETDLTIKSKRKWQLSITKIIPIWSSLRLITCPSKKYGLCKMTIIWKLFYYVEVRKGQIANLG